MKKFEIPELTIILFEDDLATDPLIDSGDLEDLDESSVPWN